MGNICIGYGDIDDSRPSASVGTLKETQKLRWAPSNSIGEMGEAVPHNYTEIKAVTAVL
jgi:hypothetical protein